MHVLNGNHLEQGSGVPGDVPQGRVAVSGKFFHVEGRRWFLKGVTYGPFAPNAAGLFLPERGRMLADFAHLRQLGANCVRVYHTPTTQFLDDALEHGLRVFIDVPWEKHRCFFEDWSAVEDARQRVRRTAREQGRHPALFALSVANEIPGDVVRFYGHRRVERFVRELVDIAKQEAPDCLTTFANYPSTEFLRPAAGDFLCFNVYLNDGQTLGAYLDRLQLAAGPAPLVLGEFGMDSIRAGEAAQSEAVADHVARVFHHGLAGSFVFAYTDDWYTGGHQIQDWAFGVTRADRTEKPAFGALRDAWRVAPRVRPAAPQPRVSVVVCSYNGAATLRECLESLTRLDYADYEVILVDDGSKDNTRQIAAGFPSVRYIRQENKGLSFARNVGAREATGEVVAYTDSDCVADPDWLYYLVDAMRRQGVDAIGGPNLPPPSDCWVAQCVAASPGGPSHVMLNDQLAEHVPGCNMAFRRQTLLDLGLFDPQFRQAGDDVDVCWRLLDAGCQIGFAASAVVWHHRRNTVRAFLKQQKGYGRSEAMLMFKHPARFNRLGCSRWNGIIYGEGAVGLPVAKPVIFHGKFGSGLFQTIYHQKAYSFWAYPTLLEWHGAATGLAALAYFVHAFGVIAAAMWALTIIAAVRSTLLSPLSQKAPAWCTCLVFALHIAQPIVRAWHRYGYRLVRKRLPTAVPDDGVPAVRPKRVASGTADVYWMSQAGVGREKLLECMEAAAPEAGWVGDFNAEWRPWDATLHGDLWYGIVVRTATEELGGPKRFTRARCVTEPTLLNVVVHAALVVAAITAVAGPNWWAAVAIASLLLLLQGRLFFSRRRCLAAAAGFLGRAARRAGLEAYDPAAASELRVGAKALRLPRWSRPSTRFAIDDRDREALGERAGDPA